MADPYELLGLSANASDGEVRAAYRRLVQLHHPDHNGGSAESARRFEEVQDAYARIRELRAMAPPQRQTPPPGARGRGPRAGQPPSPAGARGRDPRADQPPPGTPGDPAVESRLADLERAVREAHEARERARRTAREASAKAAKASEPERPSDEELGYVTTDDSFTKIFDDALSELGHKLAGARDSSIGKRVEDLIEDLDFLHSHGDDERK